MPRRAETLALMKKTLANGPVRAWRTPAFLLGLALGAAGCGSDGTSPDTSPPVVISTTPLDGAANINPRSTVSFRSSEDLDPASVGPATLTVNAASGPVPGTVSYAAAAREVVFTPDLHLAGQSVHVATLHAGIRDLAGNSAGDSTVISFTTGADPEDGDGDGYAPDDGDCADDDPAINPGAVDRPDDEGRDLNCDGFEGDVAASVFVAPGGADDAPGTPAAPLRTIGLALQRAVGNGQEAVIVARGSYAESLVLPRGVSLYGGFDAANDWARDPLDPATRSTIASVQIVLRAESIDRPTWVEGLRLDATTPVVAGESAVALLARAADALTLRNLELVAGAGAPGADGDPGRRGLDGPPGDPGAAGCEGGAAPPCDGCAEPDYGLGGQGACTDGGRGGTAGYGALPAEAGSGVTGGGTGGAAGDFGLPGGPGGDAGDGGGGAGGAGGPGPGWVDGDGLWRGDAGTDGAAGDAGSSGGGGGGGGGSITGSCPTYGGAGGGGGAGGCGGEGGRGGQGGGGSIALLLVDSSPRLEGLTLRAAGGGSGGRGGIGGDPGTGGTGTVGGSAFGGGGAGGPGGNGGNGGAGGGGGGGAGGVAFGVYRAGASQPSLGALSFIVGTGGAGGQGAPGAGSGTAGASGDIF